MEMLEKMRGLIVRLDTFLHGKPVGKIPKNLLLFTLRVRHVSCVCLV